VAVISHGLWSRHFGGDPEVLGRTISLSGRALRVVGVMPPRFGFPAPDTDLWIPFGLGAGDGSERGSHWVYAVARLAGGVRLEQAQAEMDAIAADLEARWPEGNAGDGVLLEPLHEASVAGVRPALLVLAGALGLVMLIVCANVSGLLLARATARVREMSLRMALGAGRARILRQLLTESLLLASAGALSGLLLAVWSLDALPLARALDLPAVDITAQDRSGSPRSPSSAAPWPRPGSP
jgi:putative ABC transport system permease protein